MIAMWGRRRLGEPGDGSPGTGLQAEILGKSGISLTLRATEVSALWCTKKSLTPRFQEKPLSIYHREPYRKPTQVDK
jgi:hypothetical protein